MTEVAGSNPGGTKTQSLQVVSLLSILFNDFFKMALFKASKFCKLRLDGVLWNLKHNVRNE